MLKYLKGDYNFKKNLYVNFIAFQNLYVPSKSSVKIFNFVYK